MSPILKTFYAIANLVYTLEHLEINDYLDISSANLSKLVNRHIHPLDTAIR